MAPKARISLEQDETIVDLATADLDKLFSSWPDNFAINAGV